MRNTKEKLVFSLLFPNYSLSLQKNTTNHDYEMDEQDQEDSVD